MSTQTEAAAAGREPYIAARVLDALLRENYGGLAQWITRGRDGVAVELPGGRRVRLVAGALYQDFMVAPGQQLRLAEVMDALGTVADPAGAAGVRALAEECRAAVRAHELLDARREEVLSRLGDGSIRYETLAAFADHPIYPTFRARHGLTENDLLAYAPEFAPAFELRWTAVPRSRARAFPRAPSFATVGLPDLSASHALLPVHPLTVDAVRRLPGVLVGPVPHLRVRPTLSMRTVELDPRTHLKLPLATSTLGLLNHRAIKPGTLEDGARAELLLRDILAREPDFEDRVLLADEQLYHHTGHDHLAWMIRRLPSGTIVPVAALAAPAPGGHTVAEEVCGGDLTGFLARYLGLLLRWNVRLFVRYGVALEAHQQNLSLVLGPSGEATRPRLLLKDNDGLLAWPARLRAAGITVPKFTDERMLTDDPHALADVFVTTTLHLAAAAVVFGTLPPGQARRLLTDALAAALDEHDDDPMGRLLRARTLDAARLVGTSMVTAGTLVAKARTGARGINKFYGTSGPNYLRRTPGAAGPR